MGFGTKSAAALVLALCVWSMQVWAAQPATLLRGAELKADRYTDAATVTNLAKGAQVDILRRQGGWFEVRAGSANGWLRSEAVAPTAASPTPGVPRPGAAGILALESGRSGKGDLIATTGIRSLPKPEASNTHALIMSIGAYGAGIPPLKGTRQDIESARAVAKQMGVRESNIHVWRDGELTIEGMRRALDEFDASVQENDQVFIYYSGHGGRTMVKEAGGERCAESLISVDGYGLVDTELEARLKRLSARAQKVIMFLDACHAGGATTRGIRGQPMFSPKFWEPRSGVSSCGVPTNVITRGIRGAATRSVGRGANNFVYIAAARDNEVALDQPDRGGLASQSWLECMAGEARDRDGSGGLSAEEIRACAQERIEAKLKGVEGFTPHHVTITGNSNIVLSYVEPRNIGIQAAPAQAPAAVPTVPAVAKPSPLAALNDIYHNRDDRRLVTLTTENPRLRIGKDNVEFRLTSREAGHVYLLMVGSDGETFDVLFPNQLDRNNVIGAEQTLRLPRPNWQLVAHGPAGKNTILAIVADSPMDFTKAGAKPAGPFSVIDAGAAVGVQQATVSSGVSLQDCDAARANRALGVARRCSNVYGAAILTVEEVGQ